MLAALMATLLLAGAESGCTGSGLREEMRMCVESWQLVLLSGVAHFLAIVSVNLALFHGTVTLVSIIKATELVFTASLSRVALGHKPSTKQAGGAGGSPGSGFRVPVPVPIPSTRLFVRSLGSS